MIDDAALSRVSTRDSSPASVPPKLRAFLVDESVDDVAFLICAPSIHAAREVLAERCAMKRLSTSPRRIIAAPMRLVRDGEP